MGFSINHFPGIVFRHETSNGRNFWWPKRAIEQPVDYYSFIAKVSYIHHVTAYGMVSRTSFFFFLIKRQYGRLRASSQNVAKKILRWCNNAHISLKLKFDPIMLKSMNSHSSTRTILISNVHNYLHFGNQSWINGRGWFLWLLY